mmetsp:Transcript_35935/g.100950  ORF Transcript_35935/g.100950 Transcript_35935/m.100950 type:complete len:373 (-) Transcript_35935:476-1594(-)
MRNVLEELLVGDLPVVRCIKIGHNAVYLFLFEHVAQHLLQVLPGDEAAVVHVEPVERFLDQIVVHLYSGGGHGRQEFGVVDLLLVIIVDSLESRRGVLAINMKFGLHHLLKLVDVDGPRPVGVHLYERIAHLGALLVGQGPSHHVHRGSPEVGCLGETAQGVDGRLVDLVVAREDVVALLDPRGLQRLGSAEPRRGVDHEQRLDEVLGLRRDLLPLPLLPAVPALSDQPDLGLLRAGERHVPEQQDEHRDPQAPHVALAAVALPQDLGGDVGQRAAAEAQLGVRRPELREAEVDELQVLRLLGIVEDVLKLDVSMDDAVAVDVVQGQKDLPGNLRGLALRDSLLRLDAVEQLPPIQLLHHQVQGVVGLVDIV